MSRFYDDTDSFVFGPTVENKGLLLPAVQRFVAEENEDDAMLGLLLPAVQKFMADEADGTKDSGEIKDHSGGPIYHDGEVLHGATAQIDSFVDFL